MPTPWVRQRFLVAAQVDASHALQQEYHRLYRYLRRLRLQRRRLADGHPYAHFHVLRLLAQRQVARALLPSCGRRRVREPLI